MGDIVLRAIAPADATELLHFETVNRAWFERWIGPRPDTYWHRDTLKKIIADQILGGDLMFLIRAPNGAIIGRINLTFGQNGVAQIGYRIGKDHCGQGIATRAVALAIQQARAAGLWAIEAQVAGNNPASETVLLHNGFSPDSTGHNVEKLVAGTAVTLTVYRLLLD